MFLNNLINLFGNQEELFYRFLDPYNDKDLIVSENDLCVFLCRFEIAIRDASKA